MISARGTDDVRGIVLYDLKGTQVVYNTVLVVDGPALQTAALEHSGIDADAQDTEMRNNILVNLPGGPVLIAAIAGNLGIEDNNDLFTTGHPLADVEGNQYQDLAEYQAGTGQGASSVSIDPAFPFLPDLHLATCALDGLGLSITTVAEDIDGQPRDQVAPDMGADEYSSAAPTFLGADVMVLDTDLPLLLTAGQFVSYTWSTGETSSSILASAAGPYSCVVADLNGCSLEDTVVVQVEINTAVADRDRIDPVLFPNPAHGQFTLSTVRTNIKDVMLLDVTGRVARQWTNGAVYSLGAMASGTYIVQVRYFDGRVEQQQLVVE
jgi:hypothetical protein